MYLYYSTKSEGKTMKRIVSFIVALLMLSATGLSFFASAGDLPTIPLTTKKTRMAGDANEDKTVTVLDVIVVARSLAGGWDVVINEENADVNGDHRVDLKDVVLLRRYLAQGWDVTLI